MHLEVSILSQPQQMIYGLWGKSGDRTVAGDIPALSKAYYKTLGKSPVLPFFVLSKEYDPTSGQFDLFIGGLEGHEGLNQFSLPEGLYGKIIVRPKLGVLWGPAIGEAKRYFYTQWLPASNYKGLNLEYEFHTEKSIGRKPEIALLFAIAQK